LSLLHKEALAEAKQLREVATNNAKNAIIKSITPTVKRLIEQTLMEESSDSEEDEKNVLQDVMSDIDALNTLSGDGPPLPMNVPDSSGKVTLDVDDVRADSPVVNVTKDTGETVELTTESLRALVDIANSEADYYGIRVLELSDKLSKIKKNKGLISESVKYSEKIRQFKVETEKLYKKLQESKGEDKISSETCEIVEKKLESIYREINKLYVPARLSVIEEGFVNLGKRTIGINRLIKASGDNLVKESSKELSLTLGRMLGESVKLFKFTKSLSKINETQDVKRVCNNISNLYRELHKMARNILSEADFTLLLKGLPDETDLGELDVEVKPAVDDGMGMSGEELPMELPMEDPMDEPMGDEMGGEELDLDLDTDEGEPEVEGLYGEMDAELQVDLPGDDEEGLDVSGINVDVQAAAEDADAGEDLEGGSEGGELDLDLDDEDGEEEMDVNEIVAELESMAESEDEMSEAENTSESEEVSESEELSELDELDELDEMEDEEMDGEEVKESEDGLSEGEVYEISEAALRRELKRMKGKAKNEAYDVSDKMTDPKADQYGGGDVWKEPFRDTSDADVTTENLTKKLKESARMNRELKETIGKFKKYTAKLRKELAEQSLFNEKIVHANKLLQNESLTPKMRMKVIDAIDGAESLKEVRKIYKALTEALSNKGKKKLREGNVRGSSSKPTKSGASSEKTLNESVSPEVQRWQKLAFDA